jgi:nucleotide-binding universal stress UspA family protein
MRFLVATDSVHTTAAACDYLEARLDPDDEVIVLNVSGADPRDGEDALNVANARLLGSATVETERIESDEDPAGAILDAATARSSDVIVIAPHAGSPHAGPALGGTARQILEDADIPVVVVPLSV